MRAAWNAYFFEFSVSRRRLALFRVLFFGLLAADFWLILLEHAPRFGAGDFNVSQVPALDPFVPLPRPEVVGPLYLLGGFLSLAVALGIQPRRCLCLLAPVYAGVYAWSQSDSYQHHYLNALLLVLFAMAPGEAFTSPAAGEPTRVRSWALRLVYVQIGLMYLWTAVAKQNDSWLDGATMQSLLTCEPRESLRALAGRLGTNLDSIVAGSALAVMLGEYLAGVIYLFRRLWVFGLFIIPLFHVGVEWLGLDIELFSYYMIATHLALLMPDRFIDRLFEAGGRLTSPLRGRLEALVLPRPIERPTALALAAALAALLFVLGRQTPYAGAALTGTLLAASAIFVLALRSSGGPNRLYVEAAGLLLCGAVLFGVARFSETAYNYHRQWGGFLRRQGDEARAIEMYERANEAAHGRPARHLQLARLTAKRGDDPGAMALVEEDVRRQQAALDGRYAQPRDAEAHFERGRVAKALADALAYASELAPKLGRGAEVADLRGRRKVALKLAAEAFQKNVDLSPACGEGRRELARLSGTGRSGDAGGEP